MEEEIDLRVYIDVLLRWWWLIIAGAVVTGATALIVSFLLPPKYEATAGVVMLRSRVELSLGSNFQAISDEDLLASNDSGVAISDLNKRRLQSLTAMVSNGAIAQQVIEQLGDTLDEEERDPSSLLARVRGEILEDSDTVQIVVSHRDPVKAAAIANAWAQAFEAYANSIYGDVAIAPFTDIEGQLTEAKAEYDQAQAAWVEFLAEENRIPELQRQIEEEEAIIATLRAGRQTNVNVVVNQQIEVEKRLFNTSVATAVGANLRVVENQKEEMLREFEQAYQRRRELQNLLDDARVMLRQLNEGQAVSAPTSGLSLLALKGRVFAVTSGSANTLLPFGTLDLEIPSADALAMSSTVEEQSADLKAVISVIQKEIKSLDAYIQQQADAWASGEGYQFMQILTPEYLDPTNSPAGETLNRMQEWDGLLSYAGVLNAPLDQEINRLETITDVPKAPSFIDGVTNLRGNIIPVLNIRSLFGMKPRENDDKSRIIIVDINGSKTGILVDEVNEVMRLSKSDIDKTPTIVSGEGNHFMDGICKLKNGERMVTLLNISQLLSGDELNQFATMGDKKKKPAKKSRKPAAKKKMKIAE